MSKFAVIKNGSWTGEIVQYPQDHTTTVLGPSADAKRDAGYWPVFRRDPGPERHPTAEVPTQRPTGYTYVVDQQSRSVREHIDYKDRPVDEYKRLLRRWVKRKREEIVQQDVTVNGNTYSASERLVQRIIGAVQRGQDVQGWSAKIPTTDGKYPEVNAADAQAIRDAIADNLEQALAHEADLMSQIDAATTLDDLNAIDVTTGWP